MRIKTILAFVGFAIACLFSQSQTIIPGGYVSGVWEAANSPYIIQGEITVHRDSALTVEEGTVISFYDSAFLKVEGYLKAVGTATDSIIFRSAQNSWLGIRFQQTDTAYNDNLLFYYCVFRDAIGSPTHPDGGAVSIHNRDDISIFFSSFIKNTAMHNGGGMYLENADIQIKNLEFIGNTTSFSPETYKGGALYIIDSQMILENIFFEGNESVVAGAIYSDNTSLEIRNSSFVRNTSQGGGGALVCHNSGIYGIRNCLFERNSAGGSGGAIAILERINAHITDCIFIDNSASSEQYIAAGGGVFITINNNEANFTNCKFSSNLSSHYGGAVHAASYTNYVNCLFTNNEAGSGPDHGGGAVFSYGSINNLMNCTFSGNRGAEGSTIMGLDAEIGLINSIIWDDTISSVSKIFLSSYDDPTSIHVTTSDIEGGKGAIRGFGDYHIDWSSGNIEEPPLFEIPGIDFSLSNESPCIDTGRLDTLQLLIPATDLAGNPRLYRGEIDMGCYENQTAFSVPEFQIDQEIIIYPNPAREYFYIRNDSKEVFKGKLILADRTGRHVSEESVNIDRHGISRQTVSSLSAGLYYLILASDKKIITKKLIIQ